MKATGIVRPVGECLIIGQQPHKHQGLHSKSEVKTPRSCSNAETS